jgi:hypothetical protein
MADLQTDGARVLCYGAMRAYQAIGSVPAIPVQLAKLMINIDSGGDREALTSAKPLPPIRSKPSAASESRRRTTKRSRRSTGQNKATPHGAN